MKRIDIEPDYHIWKEYAMNRGVHASVSTYLDIKTSDFYRVETTVDGKTIVTARAWLNLSDMIRLYEQNDLKVEEKMIGQYLQDKKVSKSFAAYYDLFNKYKSDYQVDDILAGKANETIRNRAKAAKFDERLSLLGLMLDRVGNDIRQTYYSEQILGELVRILKRFKSDLDNPGANAADLMQIQINDKRKEIEKGKRANAISEDSLKILHGTIDALETEKRAVDMHPDLDKAGHYDLIRKDFNDRKAALKKQVEKIDSELENMFLFAEDVFDEGQEMLILVTELTKGFFSAHYITLALDNNCLHHCILQTHINYLLYR
jgi:hypothetical protein